MQIDFHYAVTYVAARIAEFGHEDAGKIAYAAQYVDDATHDGTVCFDNKAMYTRICSAHKAVDVQNLDDVKNHLVWLPFHFLPGNGGSRERGMVGNHFIEKIVCLPGTESQVAQDMLEAALAAKGKPGSLQRLGITMHVYADTWAHQNFAGVLHEINEVNDPEETSEPKVFGDDLGGILCGWLAEKVVPPLGHGRAQIFPDMPFLSWEYRNGKNVKITRDNAEIFLKAADAMCRFMQRYLGGAASGLSEKDAEEIRTLFMENLEEDATKRLKNWLDAVKQGKFTFGSADISYELSGPKSWKAKALGTSFDLPVHSYRDDFLQSEWKLFHDALQQHRLTILHEILPQYGICAA